MFLVLVLAQPFGAAWADTKTIPDIKPIVATYDVYVGGVHLLTADILFQEQDKKYHAQVQAHTFGFWHKMLPWDDVLDSRGAISGNHFVPAEFNSRDTFKSKVKIAKLTFDGQGNIAAEFTPPSHDENREVVTNEQRRGAFDPITALLQMLANVSMNQSCAMTVGVFDGKRRFDITGTDAGGDTIDAGKYGMYKGAARLCNADFTMVSGAWKEGERHGFWQKNEKEAGREPFQIWLATISPDLPELAVRMESTSIWGLIVGHLTGWRYATADDLKP